MNGPIDDEEFEEYLQRGSAVSQHYRALDSEEVPADVDAAILERASRAVREPLADKRRAWRRWSVPVALAASAVLAISIVLESGVRHEVAMTSAPQSTTAEQEAPRAAPAPRETQGAAQRSETVTTQEQKRQLESREAAGVAQGQRALMPGSLESPPPAVESVPESEPKVEASADEADRPAPASTTAYQSVRAVAQRRAVAPAPAPMSVLPEQDAAAAAPPEMARKTESGLMREQEIKSQADETADPEKWLQHIRELRQVGEGEQADREWRAFREAFPKYPVAKDDRALPPGTN